MKFEGAQKFGLKLELDAFLAFSSACTIAEPLVPIRFQSVVM